MTTPMLALLGTLALAAPATGPVAPAAGRVSAPCTESCTWIADFGLRGWACLRNGTQGRHCVSWGDVCAIITSCDRRLTLRPDGSTLALVQPCAGEPVGGAGG